MREIYCQIIISALRKLCLIQNSGIPLTDKCMFCSKKHTLNDHEQHVITEMQALEEYETSKQYEKHTSSNTNTMDFYLK